MAELRELAIGSQKGLLGSVLGQGSDGLGGGAQQVFEFFRINSNLWCLYSNEPESADEDTNSGGFLQIYLNVKGHVCEAKINYDGNAQCCNQNPWALVIRPLTDKSQKLVML